MKLIIIFIYLIALSSMVSIHGADNLYNIYEITSMGQNI